MPTKYFILLALLMSTAYLQVVNVPNRTQFNDDHMYSGYLPVDQYDKVFFILMESRNKPNEDPLIIWLQGECSGAIAMFTENGPYNLKFNRTAKPGFNMTKNEHSWNNKANVLYLDFPLGVGFSHYSSMRSARLNEWQLLSDFYIFMKEFLMVFPQFKKRDIYFMGEGLAGNYIPYFTSVIKKANESDFNIKGIAIGNGWVDPFYQYPSHNTYAYENNLVTPGKSYVLSMMYSLCQVTMLLNIPVFSSLLCQIAEFPIIGNPMYPNFNTYDIREECHSPLRCYPDTGLDLWMSSSKMKPYLNVSSGFSQCNMMTSALLYIETQFNHGVYLKDLLDDGVPVLIFNGDKDYYYNWKGAEEWTNALPWKHQEQFQKSQYQQWTDSNSTEPNGEFKNYGSFTFFKVFNAGQMVAKDQPQVALEMVNQFMQNGKLMSKQ